MKNGSEINEVLYLRRLIKEADECKYTIARTLYEMSALSYEKGSRKGDYEIRDNVGLVVDEINQYYEQIKLFDNGKNGDMRAFEDILVFFQNSFIDTCIVTDKFSMLKEVILKQEQADKEHNSKLDDSSLERKNNVFVSELAKQINGNEIKFSSIVAPKLKIFLNNVNQILYFEKIKPVFEDMDRIAESEVLDKKTALFKKNTITFIWLNRKINNVNFSRSGLEKFITDLLEQMGFINPAQLKTAMGGRRFDEVLAGIFDDLAILESMNDAGGAEGETETVSPTDTARRETTETMVNLKTFLDDLCFVNMNRPSMYLKEYQHFRSLAGKGMEKYLFHTIGSHEITLKMVSDYHTNSLIMVFSWIRREIRKDKSMIEHLRPFIDTIPDCYKFAKLYSTAMYIASHETNQDTSFFISKTRQYIQPGLSAALIQIIRDNCDQLDRAFRDSAAYTALSSYSGKDVMIKKLTILQEFFNSAKEKILAWKE